jgi:hypothetical protein
MKDVFERCGTLAEAIVVGLRQVPEWNVVDVIVQDEYTHDVILQGEPDGPAVVLDCT